MVSGQNQLKSEIVEGHLSKSSSSVRESIENLFVEHEQITPNLKRIRQGRKPRTSQEQYTASIMKMWIWDVIFYLRSDWTAKASIHMTRNRKHCQERHCMNLS